MAAAAGKWWSSAPALRFLTLFLTLWIGVRAFSPEIWAQRPEMPSLLEKASTAVQKDMTGMVVRQSASDRLRSLSASGGDGVVSASHGFAAQLRSARQRERLKYPPLRADVDAGEQRLAAATAPSTAMLGREQGTKRALASDSGGAASGFARQMAGWSLSTWALVRDGSGSQRAALAAGELAGSQAGARLEYGFGETGRLRAYARASTALQRTEQSEVALGLSYAPIAALPVDVAIERREKLGREGRSAMAAMLVGGMSGRAMPLKFRLDAYGQAGVVGWRSRDMFADGAVVIDRSVNRNREASALRLGGVVAGAVQPHLARLDIGPRVTLPLPNIGKGARVALDWRERVAGNAQPDGGLALTLGADF